MTSPLAKPIVALRAILVPTIGAGVVLVAVAPAVVLAANQAPIVELGPDIGRIERDLGLLVFDGWAPTLLPGPSSESGQAISVEVEVTGGTYCDEHPDLSLEDCATAMFSIAPGIDPDTGTLSFATGAEVDGTIVLRAVVTDDGGTAEGGVDTTTADLTIEINRYEAALDLDVRHPWKSSCVPVTMGTDPELGVEDDFHAWYSFPSHPENGFLTNFVSSPPDPGAESPDPHGPDWWVRWLGEPIPFGRTICYVPFSFTFTGSDSFQYSLDDGRGGPRQTRTVSIEIFED